MGMSFRFKIERGSSGEKHWFYDTIFTIHEVEKKIDLSDGDCDSSAGDLEEWDFVTYENIPAVNVLFENKYPDYKNFVLTDEQKEFYNQIKNPDVRKLFIFLCIYCTKDKGTMSSFMELLDDNNIENQYSAYRSGSW